MTLRDPLRDAKAIWFCAVLVVLGGFFFVFRVDEDRIDERLAANAGAAAQLAADERRLRTVPSLETERRRLRQRLRQVDLEGDTGSLVARFLHDAAAISARHHTVIASIAAAAPLALATPTAPPAVTTAAFDGLALDLTVEGRYADVLATIRDLSAARVLAAIDVTSLARKTSTSTDPTLSATLHVVVERLVPATPARVRTQPA